MDKEQSALFSLPLLFTKPIPDYLYAVRLS